MMKLANLFITRGYISGRVINRNNISEDVFGLHAFMSCAGMSTIGQNFHPSARIYAPFSIYKGKAALSAEPVPPKFTEANEGGLRVKRQGYIMLSLSPSLGERKYDWERKQKFALSATEVGSLISLGPNGSCEFFHDPAIQTSNAGQVRKSLSVKPYADGTGYFISLSVVNNIMKTNERFTIPVTSAEFSVMRTSFSFALPHIMGWDRYSSQMPSLTKENPVKLGSQRSNSEWDR